MKRTQKLIIAVAAVLSLGLISTSVWAGSKQQHRWEGVAIGVGAVIVGSALINHHAYGYHGGPPVAFSFTYRENHPHPSRHHGYRKPHYGGHQNHWRPHDRGPRYKGHRQYGDTLSHRRNGKWQFKNPGHHGDRRSQNHGHGGRRY